MAPPWSCPNASRSAFVCSYFVLYCMPGSGRVNVLGVIPGAGTIVKPWDQLMHASVPGLRFTSFISAANPPLTFSLAAEIPRWPGSRTASFLWRHSPQPSSGRSSTGNAPTTGTAHNWLRLLVRYNPGVDAFRLWLCQGRAASVSAPALLATHRALWRFLTDGCCCGASWAHRSAYTVLPAPPRC